MRDPLPIVNKLGETLTWQQQKALVLLVGMSTRPAQDLAAALGIPDDQIEAIYEEAKSKMSERPKSKPAHGVVA